jgi:putative transposase
VRYTCIHRRRNLYPVQMMCGAMKVSPSGYYAWRIRPESRRRRHDRELTQAIRLLHAESGGTYGSPRLHVELNDSGFPCRRAKVARLMHTAGLKGCPKRRFRVTTKRGMTKASNLLDQNFSATTVNERWASDITYLWPNEGWLYLGVVMDLFSRRIIGWSMSRRLSRHLAVNSLAMALDQRQPGNDLIHHSDRGVQYMSDDFQKLLKKNGITCSMSGKGSCYDNAVVESFFASLKRERTRRRKYRTRDEARADVFDYIERFYDRKRRHGYVGNISPVLFEKRTVGPNSSLHQT